MSLKPALTFTLLSDGSSDKVLIHILDWLIKQYLPNVSTSVEFGNLRRLPNPPKKLEDRIRAILDYYACDILFVHRDAEKQTFETRVREVTSAWDTVKSIYPKVRVIPVVPIRMTESWLLFDEQSIKIAAGNYGYDKSLPLPPLQKVEKLPNPKAILYDLLRKTSSLQGRKLAKLNVSQRIHLVAEYTEDFSPLRQLSAFQKLEEDIKYTLTNHLFL